MLFLSITTDIISYYKAFQTRDHLVTVLFGVFIHCSSLQEVCGR
ncbi:MAG: DUF4372 domain-containing protein [Bacteroidetes bacterium]|nr:DUF4372 domain-containing protein [Bacteroidota bacterium]